jgi:hypothetical protein
MPAHEFELDAYHVGEARPASITTTQANAINRDIKISRSVTNQWTRPNQRYRYFPNRNNKVGAVGYLQS